MFSKKQLALIKCKGQGPAVSSVESLQKHCRDEEQDIPVSVGVLSVRSLLRNPIFFISFAGK
jgi:hypothetical protein